MRGARLVRHPVLGSLLGLLLLAPLPARADVLVAGGAQPQNQPDIAVNPLNPLNVAVAYQDRTPNDFVCKFERSTDGGRTFVPTTLPLDGFSTGSNPRVTFGPDGKLYVACQHFNRSGGANRINVFASTDGGATFGLPVAVANGTGTTNSNSRPVIAVDKTGGPGNGTVHTAFNLRVGSAFSLRYSQSTDGGQTFTPPIPVGGFPGDPFAPSIDVLPNGDAFIAVLDIFGACQPFGTVTTQCALSGARVVNGVPQAPQPIALIANNPSPVPGQPFQSNSFPGVTVAPDGRLYVAWSDFRTGAANIFITSSNDSGQTWSTPGQVTTGTDQAFHPSCAPIPPPPFLDPFFFDPDIGCLARGAPIDGPLSTRIDRITSGGAVTTETVSDVSSDPSTGEFPNNNFIGDYSSAVAASPTALYVAWTDFRNGTQDIFLDRLPVTPNSFRFGLGINQATFVPGDTLALSVDLLTGPEAPVFTGRILFGVLAPDNDTLFFFTNLPGGVAVGSASNPATWVPIASGVTIGPGTDVVFPNLVQGPIPAGASLGQYVAFIAAQDEREGFLAALLKPFELRFDRISLERPRASK